MGPTRRIENLKVARSATEVNVSGMVVMPGFVDPAIHVSLFERRGSEHDAGKRKTSLQFYNESAALMRLCLQHGTLNAQVKVYADSRSQAADVVALRQLAAIGANPPGTVRGVRLPVSACDDANLPALAAQLHTLSRRKLAQFLEVPACADLAANAPLWEVLRRADLPVNLVWPGGGASDLLLRLLALARPRAVFCPAELAPAECAALARSSCLTVFSPCKDLLEERENPSARKLAGAGGAIALSSGYDSNDAPVFSMQMVVALAVLRLRLTVEQAIVATTINAAHALGFGHEVGSLETGKRADLLVLGLSDYREIPRRIGVNQVDMALREGSFVINRKRAKASV